MISEESQKLIRRKWPGISDNKVLLEFAMQELIKYAYYSTDMGRDNFASLFDTPEQRKVNFYRKAKIRNALFLLIAILLPMSGAINFIIYLQLFGLNYHYTYILPAGQFIAALAFYFYYRNRKQLLACYDELLRETGGGANSEIDAKRIYKRPQI